MGYREVVKSYMVDKAKELELYMKANHPWQNRTGKAEEGLTAKVSSSFKGYSTTIELKHGVYYGVYLEYAMEKRFAIIEPTIRLKGPEIVSDLEGKIGKFAKVKKV
ncbi:MAG: hypothetical protein K2N51_15045 [Lachnospiraceae bacterium]|nr:hypothetical protein [Lachnospiraceae bacterium]